MKNLFRIFFRIFFAGDRTSVGVNFTVSDTKGCGRRQIPEEAF